MAARSGTVADGVAGITEASGVAVDSTTAIGVALFVARGTIEEAFSTAGVGDAAATTSVGLVVGAGLAVNAATPTPAEGSSQPISTRAWP